MAEKLELIAQTILKSWNGQASESEQRQLQQWLGSSPEDLEWLSRFENDDWVAAEIARYNQIDQENGRKRLWEKIDAYEEKKAKYRGLYLTLGKAALVAGILIGGYYLLPKLLDKQSAPPASVVQKISRTNPGDTSIVLLTLADGKEYAMQNLSDGQLSKEFAVYKTGHKVSFGKPRASTRMAPLRNHQLIIPKGGQYELELPDGSKVWLNSESSITFPALDTGHLRNVTITGEAFFEVKPDSTRPFVVHLPGRTMVEVLGTIFNVNTYPDERAIKTTLIEGLVNIRNGSKSIRITPGQQAQVLAGHIEVTDSVDFDRVTAWKRGEFNFKGDSLSAALREAARWYNVEVDYIDTPTVRVLYAGSRNVPIDTFVQELRASDPDRIHLTLINKRLTVTK